MEILNDIIKTLITIGSVLGLFGISVLVEKKAVTLKPWTAIRKWFVGDLDVQILAIQVEQQNVKKELKIEQHNVKQELTVQINNLNSKLDELTIERYMTDITDFASEISNNVPKDEAQRRLILEKIDKYENYYHKNGYVAIKGQLIKERCAEDNCGNKVKKSKNRKGGQ